MSRSYRLAELAEHVGGEVRGDPDRLIRGVDTLERAGADELSFLTNPRYRSAARSTSAGALLLGPGVELDGPDLLVAAEPYLALARILELFQPSERGQAGVSADARIAPDVQLGRDVRIESFAVIGDGSVIGDGVSIGSGTVIGADCRVGDRSRIMPRVVLYPRTRVGAGCLIHAGVVLGGDGYGFASVDGRHHKVPQLGCVVLEDEVEIGPNSTVDRAMLGETRIGAGSKLDDLVMVAHGVHLGPGTLIAAQSGIAGSTRIGAGATIAGQSGVSGHLQIGDGLVLAAKSALFEDLPRGGFVAGVPAVDHRSWKRSQVLLKRLPELRAEIRNLRRSVEILEQAILGNKKEKE